MTDLFEKPKSKKRQLLDYIKQIHYARTSTIIRWGSDHFSNGADRLARELREEGCVKRLDEEEKILRFGNTKEDVYEFVKDIS